MLRDAMHRATAIVLVHCRLSGGKRVTAMKPELPSWPNKGCRGQYRGHWVALDNCRYDSSCSQPVEGDVVDYDQDLAELCGRLREASRSKCTILFCDEETVMEPAFTGDFNFDDDRPTA